MPLKGHPALCTRNVQVILHFHPYLRNRPHVRALHHPAAGQPLVLLEWEPRSFLTSDAQRQCLPRHIRISLLNPELRRQVLSPRQIQSRVNPPVLRQHLVPFHSGTQIRKVRFIARHPIPVGRQPYRRIIPIRHGSPCLHLILQRVGRLLRIKRTKKCSQ